MEDVKQLRKEWTGRRFSAKRDQRTYVKDLTGTVTGIRKAGGLARVYYELSDGRKGSAPLHPHAPSAYLGFEQEVVVAWAD